MEKRIVTWNKTSNPADGKYSRAFVFGGYADSLAAYVEITDTLKSDFPGLTDDKIKIGLVRNSRYMDGFIVASALLSDGATHPEYTNWERFDFNW